MTGGTSNLRTYGFILGSQLLSQLGSGLGGFALGVWIFQKSGSVSEFAMFAFFASLPGLFLTPVAGVLADRWDRRRIMIASDFGSGLCTLAVALLAYAGRLQVWHVYAMVMAISTFQAFQTPALVATTVLLVTRERLSRINGIAQAGVSTVDITAPMIAGALLAQIHLEGVMAVDFTTFLIGVGTLLVVRIPRPPRLEAGAVARPSIWLDVRACWQCLAERPGLQGLLWVSAATTLCMGPIAVLLGPLVLSFSDVSHLSRVASAGALGMLAGGILMTFWRGPRRRIQTIAFLQVLRGALLIVGSLRANVTLIAVIGFLFMATVPVINACSSTVWQLKVHPDHQGRMFAVRRLVGGAVLPISFLITGPLADRVFGPLMIEGGVLAGSVGSVIGVGPGRGIALLFIVLGIVAIGLTLVAFSHPRLRQLEEEIPDAIPEKRAPVAPPIESLGPA